MQRSVVVAGRVFLGYLLPIAALVAVLYWLGL